MRSFALLLIVLVACSGAPEADPASTTVVSPTTTVASTTSSPEPPPNCPPPPYELAWLPPAVSPAADSETVEEPDEFTSIGGTSVELWVNADDETAIALIRGSLPPREFPAERGEVDVAGTRGVAGPYPDGRWVIAWFNEPGDRCDQYTMVFYPPVSPSEVEEALLSMTRLPG